MELDSFVLEDFRVYSKPIGIGSFSKVFKAVRDNKLYAIKKINIINKKNEKKFKKEFELMRRLNHFNVVKMHHIIVENNYTYFLVLDYHARGDLSNILKGKPLGEDRTQYYSTHLKDGLKYLFDKKIIHRDLKPQNILISDDNILKITDFGFARYVENPNSLINTICGSPLYMAPEILGRNSYSIVSDLWSVGVIIYQMLFGKLPFNGRNFIDLISNIEKKNIKINENLDLSDMSIDIVKRLLVKNPKERITWEEFFNHNWFKIENSLKTHRENSLININMNKVPSLDNMTNSLSYVYKSQLVENTNELSFTDTFNPMLSSEDSFLSAESINENELESDNESTGNSFVLVEKEENIKKHESFKRNVKNYLYNSLNFVKEGYDYIAQSNSL